MTRQHTATEPLTAGAHAAARAIPPFPAAGNGKGVRTETTLNILLETLKSNNGVLLARLLEMEAARCRISGPSTADDGAEVASASASSMTGEIAEQLREQQELLVRLSSLSEWTQELG